MKMREKEKYWSHPTNDWLPFNLTLTYEQSVNVWREPFDEVHIRGIFRSL